MSVISNFIPSAGAGLLRGSNRELLVLGGALGGVAALLIAGLSNLASPVVAGLAVVGILVACGMMLSPTFAVLVLCLSIPFERLGRLTNDADAVAISLGRILGIVVLASFLLHAALRRKKLYFGWPFLLYAGYSFMALMSYVWAYAPDETFRECFRILGNLIFFFLIVNIVRSYAAARTAAMVWLLASMLAGVYSLTDYYLAKSSPVTEATMGLTGNRFNTVVNDEAEIRSLGTSVMRLYGPTAHPTLFGLNMTMAIPFFVWAIRVRPRWAEKLFWAGGLLMATLCIFLSNTRAVVLLILFTVLFCVWRGLWRLTAQAAVGLLVVGLIVAAIIPEDVYRRSLDPALYTTAKGDSLRVRFKFWAKSWELVQQTWLHGIGAGNQTTLVKMVTDENTGYLTSVGTRASAHNEYIWVMVEVGILGYLFHWGFVGVATIASFRAGALFRRQRSQEQQLFAIACQTLMVGVLLFALQSEVFHYPLKGWWLAAALSCSLVEIARAQQAGNPLHPELAESHA
jgi:hypothetical protein